MRLQIPYPRSSALGLLTLHLLRFVYRHMCVLPVSWVTGWRGDHTGKRYLVFTEVLFYLSVSHLECSFLIKINLPEQFARDISRCSQYCPIGWATGASRWKSSIIWSIISFKVGMIKITQPSVMIRDRERELPTPRGRKIFKVGREHLLMRAGIIGARESNIIGSLAFN